MKRSSISLAIFTAVGLVASDAPTQTVQKASYVADMSFELPAKGQPGSPDRPSALAIGRDGSIHIADERGMIFVFDAQGKYQRSYGQGHIDRPTALALSTNGEVFVLDGGRNQVVVFGPGGQTLRTIATKGRKSGQLSDPIDLALGPSGYVYVLDASRKSVEIFSHDGVYVREVAPGNAIRDPVSITVARDGGIYLADKRNKNQILRYDPFIELPWLGDLPRGIGSRIAYRGADFADPVALAVNEFGTVLVLDKKFVRVWRANPYGGEIGPNDLLYGGIGTGRGSFKEAIDVAFAGADQVVILDKKLRKVERIHISTEAALSQRPLFEFPIRISRGARPLPSPLLAVGYDSAGAPLLALAVSNNSVQLVGTQTEWHPSPYGDSVPAFLPNPAAFNRQFSRDIGEVSAIALNDTFAVIADARKNRFAIFNVENGAAIGTYGDNYQDRRRLRHPSGVAIQPDGRIVIADTGNGRIKVFSADLASLVASYPAQRPVGVTISPGGDIAAWNVAGDWIAVLSAGADHLQPLAEGLLPGPVASLVYDEAGNLLALDKTTQRVTVIQPTLDGVLIQFGADDAVSDKSRLVLDHSGNIYLSDFGSGRTLVYRWDVQADRLSGLSVDYLEDAAKISWAAGPANYVSHYEIQGAIDPDGPYTVLGTTPSPPFQIKAEAAEAALPHYVRVVPVFITGSRGSATPPFPLFNFTVAAAYRRGDFRGAQADAQRAVELFNSGVLEADDESKSDILYYAFASAYELRDYSAAIGWAQQLGPIVTRTHIIDFLYKLAEVHMNAGDASSASQRILTLVGQDPRPEYFTDPAVRAQSFRIYRAMRNSGYAADGLEFLRLYAQAIPATAPQLQEQYRDSITVFATRNKLGPGLDYWRNASFGDAVGFFENMLLTAGLSSEQQVLSRQVLAASYYAFGRRTEAEDTFREIYTVRPSFDLNSEIPRVRTLYNLTIYNPETRAFFGNLRPRS